MGTPIRLVLLAAMLAAGPAGAQTVFKCLDGKSVTYSNTPCDKLGLKSAGEVADRVTTFQSPVPAAPGARKPAAVVPGNEVDLPNPAATRPVNPSIDKLTK